MPTDHLDTIGFAAPAAGADRPDTPTGRPRGRPRGSRRRVPPPALGAAVPTPGGRLLPLTMRTEALADALSVSRSLVKRWVADGTVKSTKVGQLRLIYTDSVMAMLKRGE